MELEPLALDRALCAAETSRGQHIPLTASTSQLAPELTCDETLAWLRELRTQDPIAPSLEAWLLRLREQSELRSRRDQLGQAYRNTLHTVDTPSDARATLAQLLALALSRPAQRTAYLQSYFASAGELAELVLRLWEERQQFAERVQAPLDSFEVVSPELAPAAREFLDSTQPAYETVEVGDATTFLTAALAEAAHDGWPARLSERSLSQLVERSWFDGLRLRSFALPRACGGASFARGLSELGRAISDAASALKSPFVLARDVFDLRRHELGALLGALPANPAFATRQLGISASRATEFVRPLARATLIEVRVAAFRVLVRELLADGPSRLRRDFPELTHRTFGFELPVEVVGAFIRIRPRDSQRFAAALHAAAQHAELVQLHDEDWFRDPRVIRQLRAALDAPSQSRVNAETLALGARALRAQLEPLL